MFSLNNNRKRISNKSSKNYISNNKRLNNFIMKMLQHIILSNNSYCLIYFQKHKYIHYHQIQIPTNSLLSKIFCHTLLIILHGSSILHLHIQISSNAKKSNSSKMKQILQYLPVLSAKVQSINHLINNISQLMFLKDLELVQELSIFLYMSYQNYKGNYSMMEYHFL